MSCNKHEFESEEYKKKNKEKFLKLVSDKDSLTAERAILRLFLAGRITDTEAIKSIIDFQKTKPNETKR